MSDECKPLFVTKQESEWLLDSFKVTNPQTRNLALKAAGLVLEFASDEAADEAAALAKGGKTAERPGWLREGAD